MNEVDTVIRAHAERDQPGATFRALDATLGIAPGHILFTILIHHRSLRQSERFYSNRPHDYPLGGRKPVTDSPWMQRVIGRGEPYIGRTAADIREVFFDHALILSLGCESVLNMPVRWAGQTVGTLNLLAQARHYDESHFDRVQRLAHLALPAMLMISRS